MKFAIIKIISSDKFPLWGHIKIGPKMKKKKVNSLRKNDFTLSNVRFTFSKLCAS